MIHHFAIINFARVMQKQQWMNEKKKKWKVYGWGSEKTYVIEIFRILSRKKKSVRLQSSIFFFSSRPHLRFDSIRFVLHSNLHLWFNFCSYFYNSRDKCMAPFHQTKSKRTIFRTIKAFCLFAYSILLLLNAIRETRKKNFVFWWCERKRFTWGILIN